jgi:parallel beta-helix repeat protein
MLISQSNLILDCQNNLIQGDGDSSGYGIRFDSTLTNVTIQNCEIEHFYHAIFRNAGNVVYSVNIFDSKLNNNINYAFNVHAASSTLVFQNNQVINNSGGISMRGGWDDSIIQNNQFINNTNSCLNSWDNGPDTFNISNNTFNNCGTGINLGSYHRYSTITQNNFINNVVDIYLNGPSTTPEFNKIYNNTLNSSKISGNNMANNFFNLSTIGNTWLDFNGSTPFCFGTPSVCDYNPIIPVIPQTPTQSTSVTSLPSISTYAIIISIISILLFSLI